MKNLTFKSRFLVLFIGLLTMCVTQVWGENAPVNTVLWGENFAHFGTKTPSAAGTGTGTTIYNSASIFYDQSSTSTKAYNENYAKGADAPELLLTKKTSLNAAVQTWTISGIPTGGATAMTLTFVSNNTVGMSVTSGTTGISVGELTYSGKKAPYSYSVEITATSVATFTLVISNTSTNNKRLDDFELKVKTAGTSGGCSCANAPSWTSNGTDAATSVTSTGATLNMSALANQGSGDGCAVTDYGFVYGTGASPALNDAGTDAASGYTKVSIGDTYNAGTLSKAITGLTAGTQYYYKAYAVNCKDKVEANYVQDFRTKVKITYDAHTQEEITGSLPSDEEIDYNSNYVVSTATISRTGYDFLGWSTTNQDPATPVSNLNSVTQNTTLYAVWKIKQYTYRWFVNGVEKENAQYNYRAAWSMPSYSPKSADCDGNKVFVGWTETPDYSNKTIAPNDLFTSASGTASEDKNFYAVFATRSGGGTVYKLVTTLTNGGEYVFVTRDTAGSGYALSSSVTTGTAVTIEESGSDKIVSGTPANTIIWTAATGWSLKNINTSTFLKINGSSFSLDASGSTNLAWTTDYGLNGQSGSGNTKYYVQCSNMGTFSKSSSGSTKNRVWAYEKSSGSTYTDYITECCTPLAAPTNLQSSPTGTGGTISWDAVDHASGYEVKIGGGEWTSVGENTSYTITGKGCGGNEVTWQVRATGTDSYCAEGAACAEQQFKTASCACGEYSFHFGTKDHDDWNATNYCFVNSSVSDGNGGTYYYVVNFELPNKPNFYVGWAGSWNTQYWESANVAFSTMPLHHLHGSKTLGTYGTGNNVGAIGTLCIRSSYNDNNKYIDFIPGGYVLKIGSAYTSYAFNPLSANIRETVWQTDLITLTEDMINNRAQVLLKTATGSVWSPSMSKDAIVKGSMSQKSDASNWGPNLNTVDAGKKGKFRLWADNSGANWSLHFVPYVQASFDANGGSCATAVLPAAPVSVEESAANRTVTLPEATKTGHSLLWSDGVNTYAAGIQVELTADKAFTAQWTAATYTITYKDKDNAAFSGTSWTSSQPTTHTYGSATELVEPRKDNYRFDGWFTTSACTGEPITSLGATAFTTNITLYAKWIRVYTVQFEENGSVVDVNTVHLAVGENTTLPSTTISECNDYDTFEGWVTATVGETTTKPGSVLAGGASYTLASAGDVTFKALYSKCEGSGPEVYEKVTSNANVTDGKYVLITSHATTSSRRIYAGQNLGSGTTDTGKSIEIGDISYANNQVRPGDLPDGTVVVTITAGTSTNAGKFAMYNGSAYLSATGGNYLNSDVALLANAYLWELTDGSQVNSKDCPTGAIHPTNQETRVLMMNNSNTNFACYTNTQDNYVFLYKKTGGCLKSYATNPSCVAPSNYTITYDANSLYGGNAAARVKDTKDWNVGTTIKAIGDCAGFAASGTRGVFVGWNTAADGSGTAYDVGATIKNKNLTLFAQWENHYYVNFYDGSHNTPSALIDAIRQTTAGQTIDLSGVNGRLACGSYNFVGWATNADVYNDNMVAIPTIVTEVTPTDADVNVYALYSKDAVSPDFTKNCAGGNYYIKAVNDMKVASDVESNYGLYEYGWYSANREEPYGNVFSISKVAANTYVIIANRTGEYLEHSGTDPTLATVDNPANPGVNYCWTIEASDVDGHGAWRVGYVYNEKNYNFYWYNNYFRSGLKSNVTSDGDYYNLDFTPAGGAASYNSNPNCAPYQITFVTNGGTMTTPAGLTLNPNGNQYETGEIAAGLVTDFTLTAAEYPGWTFEGWKKNSAQEDVTSRPGLLLNEGAAESVNNTTTYYAVYSKLDDDKPFDPDVEDTYNIYAITAGGDKLFVPNVTLDNSGRTMISVTTCAEAGDVTITPGTGVHAGQYQITMGGQKMGAEPNGTGLKKDGDAWWTITKSAHGKGTYRIALVGNDSRAWSLMTRSFGHYATSQLNNAGQTMYRDMEIGICQEMHYTSTPELIPTITLRGAPMVTSYKDKGIQATEKILVTASNFPANQKLYVTFDNADVKVLTGGSTGVTKDGENYYFQVDGTGSLENKELTIVYTPSAYGDGSIKTVTITVADNADPATAENKATRNTIKIRNLWEKFVIATKVDGQWYALPNTMSNTQSNPVAVCIAVDEGTGVATVRNSTRDMFAYQMLAGKNDNSKMVFSSPLAAAAANNIIKVHTSDATTLGLYAPSGWTSEDGGTQYEFAPTSADLVDYTLYNASQSKYLGVNTGNWGVYAESATVRFFAINEVPPATITWTNAMTDGDATRFARNVAENGVVTIPAGTPTSCSDVLYEFVGWSASHTDTYYAQCPTLIQAGDAATADAEYYAVFKSRRIARWYTKCPNVYTVIYHANGGTGADIYQESDTRTLTTQAANVFTKAEHQLVAWSTVADLSGDDGSATLYKPATEVTIPVGSSTVELYAVWMGDLQISAANPINLTSYNGVEVFTTANPANQITVTSTDMGVAKKLRFTYLNGETPVSGTSRVFRICDGSNYAQVDANINLTTGAYNQLFNLKYIPNAYDQKDTYTIRVEATNGNGQYVYSSADLVVKGRSLPEKFVVAMKNPNDGLWYALKNVLGASAEGATPAPELITVDNDAAPTKATLAPAGTFYKGAARYEAGQHRGGLRLQGFNNGNLNLTATKTDNATLYTKSGNDDDQQFYLQSSNLSTYNVTLDPATGSTRYISMNGGTIGWFATEAKDVYFLPVEEEMTPAELQVVEWKTDAVVVMYTGAATSATTKVDAGATSEAQMLASAKKDHCVYELATSDMTSVYGKLLMITFNNGGTKLIKMPLIVSGEVTASTTTQHNDVVVLKGATFSAAATNYRYPNITVYGGGKLVIGNGTKLAFSNLYLRCGGVVDGNYDYVYPQVVLNETGQLNSSTNSQLYIDYVTTKDQYYTFVTPFAIRQSAIQYPQDIYGGNVNADNTGSFEFQYYNGTARANGGTGWAVYETDGLVAGQGYTFLGMPKKINGTRQKFGLHRMYMPVATTTAQTHETTDQSIAVSAYNAERDNNAGWNLIGNPYMANVTGLSNNSIQVGKLVHTEVDGQWTGGWHWDAEGANCQRFLVIPSDDGQSYTSVQASGATLPAFKNFFVQIAEGTSLLIPVTSRDGRALAPARYAVAEEREIEIPLYLEAGEFRDALTYLIKSDYTEAYEYNADMYKMLNNKDTRVNLYGLMNTTELSFVAVNAETMNASVPVGFSVPAAGEFTIGLSNDQISGVQSVWLTDNEMNITWDLMSGDYEFNVGQKETNNTRFTLRIVMTPQTPTDISGGGGDGGGRDIRKVIFNDKLYIIVDGKVFDATGKTVK